MNKIFTIHSLLNTLNSQNTDEIRELKKLLEEDAYDFDDVFDYLNNLECDVSDEKVVEIIQFAKSHRGKIQNKEKAEIS